MEKQGRKRGRPCSQTKITSLKPRLHFKLPSAPFPLVLSTAKLGQDFKSKRDFTQEMERNVENAVRESICLLGIDPREYHPFYLRVFKYITLGQINGYVERDNDAALLRIWRKFDRIATDFWERSKREDMKFQTEGMSPYASYVLNGEVLLNGKCIPIPKRNEKQRKELFRRLENSAEAIVRSTSSNKDIRKDLVKRLEFFHHCYKVTFPADCVSMNMIWHKFLSRFEEEVSQKSTLVAPPVRKVLRLSGKTYGMPSVSSRTKSGSKRFKFAVERSKIGRRKKWSSKRKLRWRLETMIATGSLPKRNIKLKTETKPTFQKQMESRPCLMDNPSNPAIKRKLKDYHSLSRPSISTNIANQYISDVLEPPPLPQKPETNPENGLECSEVSNDGQQFLSRKCHICNETLASVGSLNRHIMIKHGTNSETYHQCPHCIKKFKNASWLYFHIRQVHTMEEAHRCDICGRLSQSRGKLWKHQTDVHGLSIPPPQGIKVIQCQFCGEKLLRGLERHIRKEHPDRIKEVETTFEKLSAPGSKRASRSGLKRNRNYQLMCKRCCLVFVDKSSLIDHVKVAHPQEYRLCPLCEMVRYSERGLRYHLRKCLRSKRNVDKRNDPEILKLKNYLNSVVKPFESFPLACFICKQEIALCTFTQHLKGLHGIVEDGNLLYCKFCDTEFKYRELWLTHMEEDHAHQVDMDEMLAIAKKINVKDTTNLVIMNPEGFHRLNKQFPRDRVKLSDVQQKKTKSLKPIIIRVGNGNGNGNPIKGTTLKSKIRGRTTAKKSNGKTNEVCSEIKLPVTRKRKKAAVARTGTDKKIKREPREVTSNEDIESIV